MVMTPTRVSEAAITPCRVCLGLTIALINGGGGGGGGGVN